MRSGGTVTQLADISRDRISRRQVDKFAERRTQLAASALRTLSELGYARTSLREIAQHSDFSHGVLHYYFRDKIELIVYSVRLYKAECVTRYDEIVATAGTARELKERFGAAMAATLVDDAPMHRLWYDMRTQSFFEESLRADVIDMDASLERMIWRVVTRYAELAGVPLTVTSPVAYAIFDGLFQRSLLRCLSGAADGLGAAAADVPAELRDSVQGVLDGLVLRG